jgi:hypothetical protein
LIAQKNALIAQFKPKGKTWFERNKLWFGLGVGAVGGYLLAK